MCKWSGEEGNWESKDNDPTKFPYHKDALNSESAPIIKQPSTPKRKPSLSPKDAPQYPDVVTKRLCLPFEFRFTN